VAQLLTFFRLLANFWWCPHRAPIVPQPPGTQDADTSIGHRPYAWMSCSGLLEVRSIPCSSDIAPFTRWRTQSYGHHSHFSDLYWPSAKMWKPS